MAFFIKRNDLLPTLPVQFFEADGVTPLPMESAVAVNMVCRAKGAGVDDPPKFKKPLTLLDAATSLYEYRWSGTDTDTAGDFEYEFEIEWPGTKPQTIPADSYFTLTVVDDIG